MDASIVIPVFNQAHYTKTCLESLRVAGIEDRQIVVVDNASTDETPALLAARPQIQVIRNETNHGCGGAWNQGSRALPATWTVILNNDVMIPKGWLEGLVSFATEESFDVVSPGACEGELDYDFAQHARQFMERMKNIKRRGTASGACFMAHKRVFDAVGFFDEDRRLGGYEDDEFFRRSRRAGFRLATTGRSFFHHFGSVTQKAIKADIGKPAASLGDREYYRQKYKLNWWTRQQGRLRQKMMLAFWRLNEKARCGCTLLSSRRDGVFIWR